MQSGEVQSDSQSDIEAHLSGKGTWSQGNVFGTHLGDLAVKSEREPQPALKVHGRDLKEFSLHDREQLMYWVYYEAT